jgi:hypothetical protein
MAMEPRSFMYYALKTMAILYLGPGLLTESQPAAARAWPYSRVETYCRVYPASPEVPERMLGGQQHGP